MPTDTSPIETAPIDPGPGSTAGPATNAAVTEFLDAIVTADVASCAAWADAVHLDATVPNWRLELDGAQAVRAEYARWFAFPGRFEALRRLPTATGEVLDYVITWTERGIPHAAHHVHILDIEDDLIVADTVMCGGRWPADLLAEIEAARGGSAS